MKRIIFNALLALAVVAVATPTMAQKKTTGTQTKPTTAKSGKTTTAKGDKTTTQGDNNTPVQGDKSTERIFHGTIYYTVLEENTDKPAPTNEINPNQQKVALARPQMKNQAAELEKKGGAYRYHYTFADAICYAQMCGIGYSFEPEKNLGTLGVARPDEPYRGASKKLCAFKNVNCAEFNKLWSLQTVGDRKASDLLLKKYYVRTGKTKMIAGYKTVRYDIIGGFAKGSIWVAEEWNLDTWFAPFWGMQHPVLEFTFSYPVEGLEDIPIHVIATEVVEPPDIQLIKEIDSMEELNLDEVEKMIREMAEPFRN